MRFVRIVRLLVFDEHFEDDDHDDASARAAAEFDGRPVAVGDPAHDPEAETEPFGLHGVEPRREALEPRVGEFGAVINAA